MSTKNLPLAEWARKVKPQFLNIYLDAITNSSTLSNLKSTSVKFL